MQKSYLYSPQNVCSRQLEITTDGDIIVSLKVVGGCPGNLQGISKLVQGRKIDEVIEALDGIRCPGSKNRQTSCPDQFAQALKEIRAKER